MSEERAEIASPGDAPPTRKSLWPFIFAAIVLVAVLALGVGVNALRGTANLHPGQGVVFDTAADVKLQNLNVHIDGAYWAQTLTRGGKQIETTGVWLVMDLSYAARSRPQVLSDIGIRDDQGRTYTVSGKPGLTLWNASPDTWERGEVAFEMPKDSIDQAGFTVFVWPQGREVAESIPMRYGVTHVEVPATVKTEAVELKAPEVLDKGQR